MMEKGVHKIVGVLIGIPMLAILQISFHDPLELWVIQKSAKQAVKDGSKSANPNAKEYPSVSQDTSRLPQGDQAIGSGRQVSGPNSSTASLVPSFLGRVRASAAAILARGWLGWSSDARRASSTCRGTRSTK